MKTVYIASPYTKGDVAQNVRVQLDIADRLMDLGYCPIVPLFCHFQHLHRHRPYSDWMKIDLKKIELADILLRLPGESSGADREVEHAKALGVPVAYDVEYIIERFPNDPE